MEKENENIHDLLIIITIKTDPQKEDNAVKVVPKVKNNFKHNHFKILHGALERNSSSWSRDQGNIAVAM